MELAQEILAYLPLPYWLRLRQQQPSFPGLSQLRTRARLINGVPLDHLTFPGLDAFDSYLGLCTYQGELSEYSHLFLPPILLLARAVKLRDVASYLQFNDLNCPSELDRWRLQHALVTEIPKIQAAALACSASEYNYGIVPEEITWTPGLLRYYRSLIARKFLRGSSDFQHFAQIAGYLRLWPTDQISQRLSEPRLARTYLKGYALTEQPLTLADLRVFRQYFPEPLDLDELLISVGRSPLGQGPISEQCDFAVNYIQPGALVQVANNCLLDMVHYIERPWKIITQRKAQDASLVLDLLAGQYLEPRLQSSLQIVAGENLTGAQDLDPLLLLRTYHPALRPEHFQLAQILSAQSGDVVSEVVFDPLHYCQVFPANRTPRTEDLLPLYSRGQLLAALALPALRLWLTQKIAEPLRGQVRDEADQAIPTPQLLAWARKYGRATPVTPPLLGYFAEVEREGRQRRFEQILRLLQTV